MSDRTDSELYPLRFKEIIRNYSFGGRWITRAFAKPGLPATGSIAETWEVCDRPAESSVVVNGPLAGKTLHELIDSCGDRLLGPFITGRFGCRFPLLIKLLDASRPLGEQAHHDDALAKKRGLSDPGKTEALEGVHVEEDMEPEVTPVTIESPGLRRTFIFACSHFALERLDIAGTRRLETDRSKFRVLTCIGGSADVAAGGCVERLGAGSTCLLPAECGGADVTADGAASLLLAYVPDIAADMIAPLRAAGVGDEAICGLGGRTALNQVRPFLRP